MRLYVFILLMALLCQAKTWNWEVFAVLRFWFPTSSVIAKQPRSRVWCVRDMVDDDEAGHVVQKLLLSIKALHSVPQRS